MDEQYRQANQHSISCSFILSTGYSVHIDKRLMWELRDQIDLAEAECAAIRQMYQMDDRETNERWLGSYNFEERRDSAWQSNSRKVTLSTVFKELKSLILGWF